MTTTQDLEETGRVRGGDLTSGQLPKFAPLIVAGLALAVGVLLSLVLSWGWIAALIVAWVVFLIALPAWSMAVEGRRKASNHLVGGLVWSAFVLAMIPLLSLIWTVVKEGTPGLNAEFMTAHMRNVLGEGGGIYHAIMGTIIITALATIISVPLGMMTAIYLVEYGSKSKLGKAITFLVDVMTGIPSIVAGLFAFALFILITGDPLPRLGIGGAVALSVLMLPTVTRSTEEMLKLVPNELREASYALGVPKWRTIAKVVLPTAVAGIVTGVTLAIARVIGETAPLLVIAGTSQSLNWNPFNGPMQTIPVFIFSSQNFMTGSDGAIWTQRLWSAALVLIAIVMTLNLVARIIAKVFAPKTGR